MSSSSNNDQLKKKSNAYLINDDFWIVNIHLKAPPAFNIENIIKSDKSHPYYTKHIDELKNIIKTLFEYDSGKNVYLIGDFNNNNLKFLTINLVSSAMKDLNNLFTEID